MHRALILSVTLAGVAATVPSAARATSTTCATSAVCAEYINTYSGTSGGVAIHGEANTGIGVRGTSVSNTGFYGASGSGNFLDPGVEGESTNNTGNDSAGAFGLSYFNNHTENLQAGVLGYGATVGALGLTFTSSSSSSGPYLGVAGYDRSNYPTYNAAVGGVSDTGIGVLAEGNGTPTLGLISGEPFGVYAVAEPNQNGFEEAVAVETESSSYSLESRNTKANSYVDVATTGDLISGGSSSGNFSITNAGYETLSGTLTTSKGIYVRTAGTSGTRRIAFGTRSTTPEIEDVGEGSLVNGRGVVTIDPALADTIDMRRAYHVFITPEGDCNQLYVTQKSPGSFVVRESHGGRSTLAFDYRIVAKPHDEDGDRLALAPAVANPAPAGTLRRGKLPAPQSPDERLRAKLGPAGYARALATLRQRLSEK
jgi:hypothetical protein